MTESLESESGGEARRLESRIGRRQGEEEEVEAAAAEAPVLLAGRGRGVYGQGSQGCEPLPSFDSVRARRRCPLSSATARCRRPRRGQPEEAIRLVVALAPAGRAHSAGKLEGSGCERSVSVLCMHRSRCKLTQPRPLELARLEGRKWLEPHLGKRGTLSIRKWCRSLFLRSPPPRRARWIDCTCKYSTYQGMSDLSSSSPRAVLASRLGAYACTSRGVRARDFFKREHAF